MSFETWVIGGATGIGAEVVKRLGCAGYNVHFTYSTSRDSALSLVDEVSNDRVTVATHHLDLRDQDALAEIQNTISSTPNLYGLVYCAAAKYDTLIATAKEARIEDTFQVNALAAIQLVRAASMPMMRQRNGRIVLLSSIAARRNGRGNSIYAATKGALESFCGSVANELAPRGITINCVAPGFVDTAMMDGYGDAARQTARGLPSRRMGTPAEIASLVSYLMAEDAAFINGAVLTADGGASGSFHMTMPK